MSIFDFIIIYLACGAPFGVYYYFQQLESANLWQNSPIVWLKCVVVTLFWLPFAFQLFNKSITKRLRNNEFAVKNQMDSTQTKEIERFEKEFLQILLKTESRISLFEFRQTFDRYVGLTLNNLPETTNQNLGEFELYKIANHENPKLATICLQRRNRLHLQQHQINARNEMVRMVETLKKSTVETKKLSLVTNEFAKLINDIELQKKLNLIFENSAQKPENFNVRQWETDIWKTQAQKPRPTNQSTLSLSQIPASTLISKHD